MSTKTGVPCPKCGAKTIVLDSRQHRDGGTRRRRACPKSRCAYRFTTLEVIEVTQINRPGGGVAHSVALQDSTRDALLTKLGNLLQCADDLRALIDP